MIRRAWIAFFMMVLLASLTALQTLDFYPPSLKKELKLSDSTTTQLKMLEVSETTRSQIPMGAFYEVSHAPSSQFVYIGRVNACRAGGCMDPSVTAIPGEEFEYFDYFILYDSTYAVQEVKVFNYQATHGHEITSKNWLKQFKKYDGSKRLVTGKNIDGISGATVSVEAIVYDIEQKTNLLREEAAK